MYFEASNSGNDVHSGHEGRKNGGGGTDTQGKEPYQFERTGTEDDFATAHPGPTSAKDILEPLQLALVFICMRTHTNEHILPLHCVLVVILCSVLCGVCVCVCVCICACHCVL